MHGNINVVTMERLLKTYDVNTSETVPPVPAPRYKRKLIAQEHSRDLLNKQDTCVNGKAVKVIPPPRRKNKVDYTVNKSTSALLLVPDMDGCSATAKKYEAYHENFLLFKNVSKSSLETKDIGVENMNTEPLLEENCSKFFDNFVNIEDECHIISNISCIGSKMPVNLLKTKETHIFKSTAENRVIDTSLEVSSNCSIQSSLRMKFDHKHAKTDDKEENRVTDKFPECSATVVGVFYKPGYNLLHEEIVGEEVFSSQTKNQKLCSKYLLPSNLNYGNKTAAVVPINRCEKAVEKCFLKDSDENDSGVYFSDTKSPPHVDKVLSNIQLSNNSEMEPRTDYSFAFYNPFSYNASDTIDNKPPEEPGPQNYQMMLDFFEGQTVKSFREQTASQFQLHSKQITMLRSIEDWLQTENGGLVNEDSNFHVYLNSMLENCSRESLSPYPLSTVDEDDKSDSVSEEFKESKLEDFNNKTIVPETCTLDTPMESRFVDDINYLDFVVDTNCVSMFPVNSNNCNVTFDKRVINNVTDCTTETKQISVDYLNCEPINISDDFHCVNLSLEHSCIYSSEGKDDLLYLSHHSSNEKEGSTKNGNPFLVPSEQPGFVTSLIEFFENVCKETYTPISNESFHSEEDIKKQNIVEVRDIVIQKTTELYNNSNISVTVDNFADKKDMIRVNNSEVIDSRPTSFELCVAGFSVNPMTENTLMVTENVTDLGIETKKNQLDFEFSTKTDYLFDETGQNSPFQNHSVEFPFERNEIIDHDFKAKHTDCNSLDNCQHDNNVYTKSYKQGECYDDSLNSPKKGKIKQDFKNNPDLNQFYNSLGDGKSTISNQIKTFDTSINDLCTIRETQTTESDAVARNKHEPSRLPIIVRSDSTSTCPTDAVKLFPLEDDYQNNTGLTKSITDTPSTFEKVGTLFDTDLSRAVDNNINCTVYQNDDFLPPENSINVVLEKNWGSVGVKLQADDCGVLVSAILEGGAAHQSGLVSKGWMYVSTLREEVEIFC